MTKTRDLADLANGVTNEDIVSVVSGKVNFTQAGTGAVQRTVESKLQDVVSVKDFGAVGDGTTNDAAAIQAALNTAKVVYFPPGTYAVQTALSHPSNVTIFGSEATIKATAAMTGILEASTMSNLRVEGLKFDANQNCSSYTINYGAGCTDVVIDSCELINWTNGIRVASSTTNRAERVKITNNYIHTPATSNAYYPLSVQSTTGGLLVTDVAVENNTIVGVPGAFSASNQQTADQINLQGVQDFTCCNNSSFDGGEMGITVSRLSQRGLISGNVVKNSDSHGINLGSGYMAVRLSGTINTAVALTSSVAGVSISSAENFTHESSSLWYGLSLTGGKITVGSTISDGTNTRTVDVVWFTRDLICSNNTIYNVATDAGSTDPSSGIFVQQTDDITISNNTIKDTRTTPEHQYGIDARQSNNLLILANRITNTAISKTIFQGTTSFEDVQLYGNVIVNNTFITPKPSTSVIAGGAITITSSYARVDTEAAAAADDLDTINGGQDGQRLVVQSASAARDVTLKDNTGNLRLAGDFILSHTDDTIELIYNASISRWCEISRSDNAV